jgi:hypothetical protein
MPNFGRLDIQRLNSKGNEYMSTNYYAKTNACNHCNRVDYVHLGKTSWGWAFSFQGSDTVRNFDDWCNLVRSADLIEDEYQSPLIADEMIQLARDWQKGKQHATFYPNPENWLDENGYSFTDNDFS